MVIPDVPVKIHKLADAAGRLAGLKDEQFAGLDLLFCIVWRDGYAFAENEPGAAPSPPQDAPHGNGDHR